MEGGGRGRSTGTHVGVQWEVEVPPELLDGTATPVFKHMQVGAAPELYIRRSERVRISTPKPAHAAAFGVKRRLGGGTGHHSLSLSVPLTTESHGPFRPILILGTHGFFQEPRPHGTALRPRSVFWL